MVNFANFEGLKSVLKFHIFLCVESMRIRLTLRRTGSIFLSSEELVLNFHKC